MSGIKGKLSKWSPVPGFDLIPEKNNNNKKKQAVANINGVILKN